VFMAYLQRVVSGGGYVDREFGAGLGRIDVLIRKPYTGADGKPAVQKEVVELKVRRAKSGDPLADGLAQLDRYLDQLGMDTGYVIIFDRRPKVLRGRPRPEISGTRTPDGRPVTLLRALSPQGHSRGNLVNGVLFGMWRSSRLIARREAAPCAG
jgi:hypothetical protein